MALDKVYEKNIVVKANTKDKTPTWDNSRKSRVFPMFTPKKKIKKTSTTYISLFVGISLSLNTNPTTNPKIKANK